MKFDELADRLRNWGRWGAGDGRGTLNHIGAEELMRAVQSVTAGKLFHLGLRFDQDGPQLNGFRFNPRLYVTALTGAYFEHNKRTTYSDDVITMPLQCATQWDALGHAHYDGLMYNGCQTRDVIGPGGTTRNGVEHLASPGIMSRGVLLDVARHFKLDRLPTNHAITIDELEAVRRAQGIDIMKGDIVLVRTGHIRSFTQDRDRVAFNGHQAGLDARCAEWIHDHSLAAIAADNVAVEFTGPETMTSDMPYPLHTLCIREMGCPLGEMFDLDALAADCAADGRYSFLLAAPPLAITGAFGSPVNPLALK